jgi:hypothetical protein
MEGDKGKSSSRMRATLSELPPRLTRLDADARSDELRMSPFRSNPRIYAQLTYGHDLVADLPVEQGGGAS